MKIPASKPLLFAALLAFAASLAVTSVPAAAADSAAEKKRKKEEADLRKYDKNGNGKLDPDEEAAKKADQAKKKERNRKKN